MTITMSMRRNKKGGGEATEEVLSHSHSNDSWTNHIYTGHRIYLDLHSNDI